MGTHDTSHNRYISADYKNSFKVISQLFDKPEKSSYISIAAFLIDRLFARLHVMKSWARTEWEMLAELNYNYNFYQL